MLVEPVYARVSHCMLELLHELGLAVAALQADQHLLSHILCLEAIGVKSVSYDIGRNYRR